MYTVFGYNDLCVDFEFKFDGFISAIKAYRKLKYCCVVFIMRETPETCLFVFEYEFHK